MTSCLPVPRGTAGEHTGPSMHLLTVNYTYRPVDRKDQHDSYGTMYLFGNFYASSTKAFLHQLFHQRHGNATLVEFTLANQQP